MKKNIVTISIKNISKSTTLFYSANNLLLKLYIKGNFLG